MKGAYQSDNSGKPSTLYSKMDENCTTNLVKQLLESQERNLKLKPTKANVEMIEGKLEGIKGYRRLAASCIPLNLLMSRAGLEPATHWLKAFSPTFFHQRPFKFAGKSSSLFAPKR
jgi:hypothetical protein